MYEGTLVGVKRGGVKKMAMISNFRKGRMKPEKSPKRAHPPDLSKTMFVVRLFFSISKVRGAFWILPLRRGVTRSARPLRALV